MLISDCMHWIQSVDLLVEHSHSNTLSWSSTSESLDGSKPPLLRWIGSTSTVHCLTFDVQFSVRSRARARRSVLLRFSRRQTVLSLLPGPSPEIHIHIFLFCDADIPDICDADLRNIHSVSFSVTKRNFSCWPASYDVRSTLRGTCQPCVSENATGW